MHIPDGYASAAFIHNDTGVVTGTAPYIWTLGMHLNIVEDPQEAANDLFNAFVANLLPEMSNFYTLTAVELTVPDGLGGTGTVSSTEDPAEGANTDLDPVYVAFAPKVRKITAGIGRKNRGVFHPVGLLGIDQVDSNGHIGNVRRADLQEVINSFATDVGSTIGDAVILHDDPAVTPTVVVSAQIQGSVGVLRNRMV